MVEQVSTGILKPMFAAFENEKPLPEKPILQVMKVGLTNQNTQNASQQRYRVAFSDGREYVQGKGLLERGQLVRLNSYSLTATHSSGSPKSNNPPQIMPPQSLQRPQAPQVRPPQQPSIRPITSQVNDADEGVFPISYLSSKSEIKRWQNKRGEGKLFNVTLLDNSGEIRATAFNQQVDDFFNVLQEGKLFYISKARINVAKKQYSSVKNDYEITLESGTQIIPCPDDDPMNMLKFDFVPISDLLKHEKDSTIGKINKRELTIVDQSGYMVKMTLWGQQAENFAMFDNPVVVCKSVKVGDYQVFSGTTLLYNPDIHEAKELRDWYRTIDENQEFNSFSGMGGGYIAMQDKIENRKTIEQVKSENLGSGEKKENNYYPACANAGCNKKVSDENRDDGWYCEKCGRTFSEPNYRYIASISVADHTDSAWFQCFNDAAEIILGISANDLPNISPVDYITQSNEMLRNIKILDPEF
ncbi:6612_t:CDS:10 [Diversispora eburnea]|uniref:6612_t:CDS:1 n=1 Tax=Diversispora eburnea TaxID=1213867 RepID=A0A9N8ZTL9_9GLOM|nr:6612_t:CDS:10 [Diversispora eburnea]